MDLTGKRIILTGASSGIGAELLSQLAEISQIKIIAVARSISNIKAIEGKVFPFSADLSQAEQVDRMFDYAEQIFQEIDIFIANAGYGYLEKLGDPDWKHIENIFSLNVFSPVYSLQKFIQGNSFQCEKAFVSVISGAAFIPMPAYALYSSTKAALHHFMETFRHESDSSLHIVNVYPIATRTDFFKKASNIPEVSIPYPSQSVQKVAKSIINGIRKNKKQVYPSLIFQLAYPIVRAFPSIINLYTLVEKRRVKDILSK